MKYLKKKNKTQKKTKKRKCSPYESPADAVRNEGKKECDFQKSAGQNFEKREKSSKKKTLHKFICNDCGAFYNTKQGLKLHINGVHLKLKPHECDQCEKSFSQKPHLKSHVEMVHQKLKPFKCKYCKYSFAHNSNLKKHAKTVL